MRWVVISLAGAILFMGCQREKPSIAEGSGFPEPVARILVQRCAGCHGGGTAPSSGHGHEGTPPPAGSLKLNLSRWDSLLYGYQGESPLIIPFTPAWSHLLWYVNRNPSSGPVSSLLMPPPLPDSSNLLSPQDIEVLRAWIAQGAPNARGELPWNHRRTTGRRKAFVCASGSDLIAVLDLDTYHIMHCIPVGIYPAVVESPHYVQVSPDERYVYVTLINGAAIEKYRTDTYEKVGRVEVGPAPAHIEFSPEGRYAVVTHFTTSDPVKLTLLDAENLRVLDELRDPAGQVIARPHGLWLSPDFRYAYVTANSGNYITKVEISPDRQHFVDFTQIPLERGALPQPDPRWGPYQIVSDPAGQYLFVSCDASNEVRIFSRATDSLVAVLPTAAGPKLMAYHEGLLYVNCLKASAPPLQGERLGAIAVVDATNLRLLTHVYGLGHLPRGIGVDPLKNQLIVSFENLAGADPPHHYTGGLPGSPGKVYFVQLPTLQVRAVREIALAGYGLTLIP